MSVIPVRGGSKGIPRKNVLPVGGKPLVVWTIQQALAVHGLDVVVSTEDDEIADVARAAGAVVVQRPVDLARDETPTEPVVLDAIEQWTRQSAQRPEAVMLLQATSPVRLDGTLARAIAQFRDTGVDSLVGVVPCPPFLWGTTNGETVPYWDFTRRARRQDMTEEQLRYRETGSLYITRTEIYERANNRLGGRIGLFVMDDVEGVDIDTMQDLGMAEATLSLLM